MGRQARVARSGPPRSYVLDGEVYELTGSWWPLTEHLGTGERWQLGLLLDITHPEDAGALYERLVDPRDDLTAAVLAPVADALVLAATGEPWWVAGRLLATAAESWAELDGTLLGRGLDLAEVIDAAPARACNLVYAWLIEGADEKGRAKIDHKLRLPPPEMLAAPTPQAAEWFAEDEGAAFAAAMGEARAQGLIKAG